MGGQDGTPVTAQVVQYDGAAQFTLAPASGSRIANMGGSCGGNLVGDTFTTDPVVDDFTAVASFELKPEEIFNDGFEEGPRIVIVSSTAHNGNALGGLTGADNICNARAAEALLPGNYVAWLSTSSPAVNARDRIGDHKWVRTDGAAVADSLADLTDGTLQNPINRVENGVVTSATDVWTGTSSSGTFAGAGNSCWASPPGVGGLIGKSAAIDGTWTQFNLFPSCNYQNPIYCFGN